MTMKAAAAYADKVHGQIEVTEKAIRDFKPTPHPEPLMEMYEGKMREVVNPDRQGWWRFHEHYDRNGYCDNPGRGY